MKSRWNTTPTLSLPRHLLGLARLCVRPRLRQHPPAHPPAPRHPRREQERHPLHALRLGPPLRLVLLGPQPVRLPPLRLDPPDAERLASLALTRLTSKQLAT